MENVEKLRSELMDKILSIRNKEFLEILNKFITASLSETAVVNLSDKRKEMLQMSEKDIKNGRLISQENMNKRNIEWLTGM